MHLFFRSPHFVLGRCKVTNFSIIIADNIFIMRDKKYLLLLPLSCNIC